MCLPEARRRASKFPRRRQSYNAALWQAMRRSTLATALLLLAQADAACMSGMSCSGSSGYGWKCNNMVNNGNDDYCCCTNTAYNSGKFCSLESDCLGSAAAAGPPPPSPSPPPACTDLDNGATDMSNDPCSWYVQNSRWGCGVYDDSDFSSNTMCCACGGGCTDLDNGATDTGNDPCSWYVQNNQACGNYDDADFSSNTMCCACGRGSSPDVPHSDCTTGCGDPGLSRTGAPAVAGRCYRCYNPTWIPFNCPAGTDYRYNANGLLLQQDDCCDKRSCTFPPRAPPPPSPSPPPPPPPSPSPPPPQPSSPSPPPPPSPSPPPSPCACDTVSVALTGAAYGTQSSRAGQYTKMSATQGGRSVYSYAHAFRTEYLYFWADYSNWRVGSDYTSPGAGLQSTSNANTPCPENEGDSWQYYDGSSWQSGGVQVQCTGPSPPPPPPSPSPPPPPSPLPPTTTRAALDAGPSNVETGSDSSSMGAIIGGAGEQTAPPCNLARDLARRPHGLHRSPHPPPGTPLAAWRSVAYWSAPASTPR